MSDFLARILGVVPRIYNFPSGDQGIQDMELGLPIQRVHDVSREAELGAGYGRNNGYVMLHQINPHVGASTERSWINPLSACVAAGIIPQDQLSTSWCWILGAAVNTTAGNLSEATVGLIKDQAAPGIGSWGAVEYALPIVHVDEVLSMSDQASVGNLTAYVGSKNDAFGPPAPPHPMFEWDSLSFRSITTGANEVLFLLPLWVGPIGCTPAGFR